MKAVILAGGFGKRLSPITDSMPKPMVPVLNNPLIDYSVRLLNRSGIFDIGIGLGFMPESIVSFLDSRYGEGAFKYNIECKPLGTAGCVKRFESFLGSDSFVVLSGDAFTDIDLNKMYMRHNADGNHITIAVKEVEDPSGFGVVVARQSGEITDFQEKPQRGTALSKCVSTGIYILEPSVLSLIPDDCAYDFAHDLFPVMLAKEMKMGVYTDVRYWSDVGTPESFLYANIDALCGNIDFDAFYGGLGSILDKAESQAVKTKNSVIHNSANFFEDSVSHNSVIARGVTVEPDAVVANAVALEGAHISSHTVDCICGAFGQIPIERKTTEFYKTSEKPNIFSKGNF